MFCRCVFLRKLFFSCVNFSCYRSRLVSTGSDYRCIGNVPADRRAQLPLAHTLKFFLPVCFFCEKWSESAETVFFVLSALFGFFFSKSFEMGSLLFYVFIYLFIYLLYIPGTIGNLFDITRQKENQPLRSLAPSPAVFCFIA